MPHLTVTVEFPSKLIAGMRNKLDVQPKGRAIREVMTALRGLLHPSYANRGLARVCIASACASQTVNCDYSDAVDGTDDITIGGTTLSVEASPATEDEFDSGTDDAEFADNLAAAINAHSVLSKIVRATSDGVSDVTITSLYPGPIGNLILLAESGNGLTLGDTALAGGASDEVDSHAFGYVPST